MTSRTKALHILTGIFCFILLARLQFSGTGGEQDFYRYLIPILLGTASGIMVSECRQSFAQKNKILLQTTQQLEQEIETNRSLLVSLEDMQSSHELILDSIGEGIYGVSHTGKTLFINRAMLNATGFDEDQLLRENQHALLHHTRKDGSPYPENECPVRQTCLDGKIRKVEGEVFWRRDGSSFPVEYIVTPTNEIQGVFGAVVIFRDISRQVLIEEHLEASEEQFRTLFDTSTEAILIMDDKGRITNANPATFRLLYCQDGNQLLGKSLTDFCHSSQEGKSTSGETLTKLLTDALSHGSSFSEWELQREDFKKISAAVLLARMDLEGTVFIQANIRDISAQKQTEQKLQKMKDNLELQVNERTEELLYQKSQLEKQLLKQKRRSIILEQESIAKSQFITNTSTKFQPALQSIVTLSERLLADDELPTRKTDLKAIRHYTDRLLAINADTEILAQLESGKLNLNSKVFNIRSSVQEAVNTLAQQARDKGLTLQCNLQSTIAPNLVGDPDRLQTILLKFLENSIRFTKQGQIKVIVQLKEQIDEKNILLSFFVSDTGRGIDPKKQKKITALFNRQSTRGKAITADSGLGLHISCNLIKLMGGSVGFESLPGKGSQFWFTIPFVIAERRKDSSQQETSGVHEELSGRRILVADDEFINRRMFSSILETHGAKVHCVEDGDISVAIYQREPFDCILMDVQMPHRDGFEATRAIRQLEEEQDLKRTPIIGLTAHAISGYKEKCQDAGMDNYVTKPVDADELVEAICKLLA